MADLINGNQSDSLLPLVRQHDEGDGTWSMSQASHLRYWNTSTLAWEKATGSAGAIATSGGGAGGGAATIADGADVAQGTTSDVAWVSGSGTVIALLKKIASAGGSAVSVADGADVAQGTTTDPSSASTVVGILKAIKAAITGTLTTTTSWASAQHIIVDTAPSTAVTGPLTDTQLRATAVPVSGTFFPGTQPVSLATNTPDVTDRAARLLGHVTVDSAPTTAVTGTFFQATQPVSLAVAPTTAVTGPLTDTQLRASVVPVDVTPAAPVATDYLPVRLTDGTIYNYNQATYMLYQSPRVTTAAATDFFDLFNAAGSGKKIRIMGLYPVIQVTAASAIIPSFQFSIIKTSAVGTGGTAHTFEGAAAPASGALNITRSDGTDATLPAQITSRSLPTGGATAAKFLFDAWLCSEETNAATYLTQMFNWVPTGDAIKEVILAEGEGVKIRQITATASTGTNFGWLIAFTLV